MKSMKPHAVCIPIPAQGHINPMLKLAKLLHFNGSHITFVHTEFNYQRILSSRGPDAFKGLDDFQFESISDGLPPTVQRGIHTIEDTCITMPRHSLPSFRELIKKLNASPDVPAVSCIVSDGFMSFTLEVADEFGIPGMVFFTSSACGLLSNLHYDEFKERGYVPFKDSSCLTKEYLDTVIEWIPAMKGVRLKDFPSCVRSPDHDIMFNYISQSVKNCTKAKGAILNTFDDLEKEVLDAVKAKYPVLYTVRPLPMLCQQFSLAKLEFIESNLWKEDAECLNWLDERKPKSVVYVNHGSLVTITPEQLEEFAWGLANSKHAFLWVIRPDLIDGEERLFVSNEFTKEIKDRGLLVGWCPQEKVLSHPSIGGFLTHCGWNSTMESISQGVPLICWPFFGEQHLNCFYSCARWGIGIEVEAYVKRDQVEKVVKEVMEGDNGQEMREKVTDWKKKAEVATKHDGSSHLNFDRLVKQHKT